jgi:hypothetical protein
MEPCGRRSNGTIRASWTISLRMTTWSFDEGEWCAEEFFSMHGVALSFEL